MKIAVEILIATLNGFEYIRDLLESLLNQSYKNILITIHDDNSKDNTCNILNIYEEKHPKIIRVIRNKSMPLGVTESFSRLIAASREEYIMLCDQDDIWLPDKVTDALTAIISLENEYGKLSPFLVHTDLIVVDQNLNVIDQSFYSYTGIPDEPQSLKRILNQNFVTGCTILMNRPLANLSFPIPVEAIHHDWWLALVAFSVGHVRYLGKPAILYRQHSSNVIGAKQWSIKLVLAHFVEVLVTYNIRETLLHHLQQAIILSSYLGDNILPRNRKIIDQHIRINSKELLDDRIINNKFKSVMDKFIQIIGNIVGLTIKSITNKWP